MADQSDDRDDPSGSVEFAESLPPEAETGDLPFIPLEAETADLPHLPPEPDEDLDVAQKMSAMPIPEHMARQLANAQAAPPVRVAAQTAPKPRLELDDTAASTAATQTLTLHELESLAENDFTGALVLSEEDDEPQPVPPFAGLALVLCLLAFPLFASAVVIASTIEGWYPPATPALLYLAVVVPITLALRATAESELVRALVPKRTLAMTLLIGLAVCGSWSLAVIRSAALGSERVGNSTWRQALRDTDDAIAARACLVLAEGDRSTVALAKIADVMSRQALSTCLTRLPQESLPLLARQVMRRFERKVVGEQAVGLTCEDVDVLRSIPEDLDDRWRGLWSCVTQPSNPALRSCCAAALRSTDQTHLPMNADTVTSDVLQWQMAAAFHGFGQDAQAKRLGEELAMSSLPVRSEVLELACAASFGARKLDLVKHVRASIGAACPRMPRAMADAVRSEDWFVVCNQLAGRGVEALCEVTNNHLQRAALDVASGGVTAAICAYDHGAYSAGIKSGYVKEQRDASDPLAQLADIEEQTIRAETGDARSKSLDSVRSLESDVRSQRSADTAFRGFAPFD